MPARDWTSLGSKRTFPRINRPMFLRKDCSMSSEIKSRAPAQSESGHRPDSFGQQMSRVGLSQKRRLFSLAAFSLTTGARTSRSPAYKTLKSFFALCAHCGRDVRAPSCILFLGTHSLLQNVLQLKGVRHAQQCRRAQPEWPALSVGRKLDPIAERIGVGQCRLHV
jgi:hypothetical protein